MIAHVTSCCPWSTVHHTPNLPPDGTQSQRAIPSDEANPLPTFFYGTRTSTPLVISLDQPFGFHLVLFDSFARSRIFVSCGRAVSEFRPFWNEDILYHDAEVIVRLLTTPLTTRATLPTTRATPPTTSPTPTTSPPTRDPTDAADDARTT
ncbi:hypothetical protein EV715DRAFT_297946 [Schizophyllum commune]